MRQYSRLRGRDKAYSMVVLTTRRMQSSISDIPQSYGLSSTSTVAVSNRRYGVLLLSLVSWFRRANSGFFEVLKLGRWDFMVFNTYGHWSAVNDHYL